MRTTSSRNTTTTMAQDSGNGAGTCDGINGRMYELGCLAPALLIILILASLRRRVNFKHEYCNGYPGLLIPINFLGGFSNRYAIAATFGATASTCLAMFLERGSFFYLPGPAWVKVFRVVVLVLVYGILFYPFFACLTTEYKLVGSFLGFVYVTIRFSFKLVIDFQCGNNFTGDAWKVFYLSRLGKVPTYLCLLFILVRFAVLLYLEVRKKWFPFASGRRSGVEISDIRLARDPEIAHIKELLNPGSVPDFWEMKWYPKLLHPIYKPRKDFLFSTQLISTLLVCAITIFQLLVAFLTYFDVLRLIYIRNSTNDTSKALYDVLYVLPTRPWLHHVALLFFCTAMFVSVVTRAIGLATPGAVEAGLVASAFFSVLSLLHFMKCHRQHVLQMYRGETELSREVYVSPAGLVGKSLRFSGYLIAYTLIGYLTLWVFLFVVAFILAIILKHPKNIFGPEMAKQLVGAGLAILPTAGMAFALWLFQMFLAHVIFRDRDYPNITVSIDNRRWFSIMSYFFFFYNILLGMFSCTMRMLKGMLLGVIFISRIDRTTLMQGFQTWDKAFVAYLGFVTVLVAHRHPVMLVFCQLLLDRNKDYQPLQERHHTQSKSGGNLRDPSAERLRILSVNKPVTSYSDYRREPRLPRMSQKAFNRWFLAVTLLRNPSLISYRCQDRAVRPILRLGSINIGDQV